MFYMKSCFAVFAALFGFVFVCGIWVWYDGISWHVWLDWSHTQCVQHFPWPFIYRNQQQVPIFDSAGCQEYFRSPMVSCWQAHFDSVGSGKRTNIYIYTLCSTVLEYAFKMHFNRWKVLHDWRSQNDDSDTMSVCALLFLCQSLHVPSVCQTKQGFPWP